MKRLPIGTQTFSILREDNCVYVDKTDLVYKLTHDGRIFFLSRPRRFGKSLLVSTLDAYFSGRKDLFQGLAIEKLETEWKKYPVIRIDFSGGNYEFEKNLDSKFDTILSFYEKRFGVEGDKQKTYEDRFFQLIVSVSEKFGEKVVVLIDEYDKPILDALYQPHEDINRKKIRGFYSVLKNCDEYLKFVFLTGITKVSQINIFSGLNQIQDISMSKDYSTICGITQDELLSNFDDRIEVMAAENEMTKQECVDKLKKMYDGYHFSKICPDIYNPFSVLNALQNRDFVFRWFQSGTPTMLLKVLENQNQDVAKFVEPVEAEESEFNNFQSNENGFLSLVYQSGYLTIKSYDKESDMYTLGLPNFEVTKGFYSNLVKQLTSLPPDNLGLTAENFRKSLRDKDFVKLEKLLNTALANLPYLNEKTLYEDMYRNVLHMIFTLTGFDVIGEYACNTGRADIVVQTPKYVYIFELKMQNGADLDKKASEALSQIDLQNYAGRFDATGKQIIKIALVFSDDLKGVGRVAISE